MPYDDAPPARSALKYGAPKNIVRRDPRSGKMPYDDAPPARNVLRGTACGGCLEAIGIEMRRTKEERR